MFKAIGRWGSQVRSTINLQIFSNLFGSKSKKYDDLDNDDEEVFIDAQEDIAQESEAEADESPLQLESVKNEKSETDGATEKGGAKTNEIGDVKNTQITTQADVVVGAEGREEAIGARPDSNIDSSNHTDVKTKKTADDGSETEEHDSGGESEDDDDHHINHKDTKQMVKNSKQSNGLVQSASAAMLQKVHRRMNSYSQRQYSKFDNAQDDENDNVIHSTGEFSRDNVDSNVTEELEQAPVIKSEKKPKRKKKIAKRTKKAVKGSWKWFKRSMVAYAYTFNFTPTFIVNIVSTRKT